MACRVRWSCCACWARSGAAYCATHRSAMALWELVSWRVDSCHLPASMARRAFQPYSAGALQVSLARWLSTQGEASFEEGCRVLCHLWSQACHTPVPAGDSAQEGKQSVVSPLMFLGNACWAASKMVRKQEAAEALSHTWLTASWGLLHRMVCLPPGYKHRWESFKDDNVLASR